jgi:hypothetical protein
VKFEFHPAADAELRGAANFYEDRVLGLGAEFLAEVERACSRLSDPRYARNEVPSGVSDAMLPLLVRALGFRIVAGS